MPDQELSGETGTEDLAAQAMGGAMEVPPAERLTRNVKSELMATVTVACAQHPMIHGLSLIHI